MILIWKFKLTLTLGGSMGPLCGGATSFCVNAGATTGGTAWEAKLGMTVPGSCSDATAESSTSWMGPAKVTWLSTARCTPSVIVRSPGHLVPSHPAQEVLVRAFLAGFRRDVSGMADSGYLRFTGACWVCGITAAASVLFIVLSFQAERAIWPLGSCNHARRQTRGPALWSGMALPHFSSLSSINLLIIVSSSPANVWAYSSRALPPIIRPGSFHPSASFKTAQCHLVKLSLPAHWNCPRHSRINNSPRLIVAACINPREIQQEQEVSDSPGGQRISWGSKTLFLFVVFGNPWSHESSEYI